jgi:hypothetical protein
MVIWSRERGMMKSVKREASSVKPEGKKRGREG